MIMQHKWKKKDAHGFSNNRQKNYVTTPKVKKHDFKLMCN